MPASILDLTREQNAQQLDREVRRYRAGLLKDRGQAADLLALTNLLAEDDPLCAAA